MMVCLELKKKKKKKKGMLTLAVTDAVAEQIESSTSSTQSPKGTRVISEECGVKHLTENKGKKRTSVS